jgi:hypothetical protein
MADALDAQLGDLLAALPEVADPLDAQLADILAAAHAVRPRERYTQRGTLLLDHARQIKSERSQSRKTVAPHILDRIERFHQDYAVRSDDRIELAETSPAKSPGTGKWRQWLPAAILRCCWGLRPRRRVPKKVRRRVRVKSKPTGPHRSAPTTASARIRYGFNITTIF